MMHTCSSLRLFRNRTQDLLPCRIPLPMMSVVGATRSVMPNRARAACLPGPALPPLVPETQPEWRLWPHDLTLVISRQIQGWGLNHHGDGSSMCSEKIEAATKYIRPLLFASGSVLSSQPLSQENKRTTTNIPTLQKQTQFEQSFADNGKLN